MRHNGNENVYESTELPLRPKMVLKKKIFALNANTKNRPNTIQHTYHNKSLIAHSLNANVRSNRYSKRLPETSINFYESIDSKISKGVGLHDTSQLNSEI